MRLLASGRQADVFEIGNGRVLRHYRSARGALREASVMEHARAGGYPVPAVHDASETDLVLDRVDGPTMLADLERHPWRILQHARTLASLHEQLHAIAPPPDMRTRFGPGDSLLHLDLHPENVLLGEDGPFVIDWASASAGPGPADVAQTWVLVATSDVDSRVARIGRSLFLRSFLHRFDLAEVKRILPKVARARLDDPNVRPGEQAAVERLASA